MTDYEPARNAEATALFIDVENLVGMASSIGLPLDVGPVITRLKSDSCRIVLRRSFGDLKQALIGAGRAGEENFVRKMLHKHLVQIEDIPYITANKNSGDVRLAVEALSVAFQNREIVNFAVITSDRDYVPLYNKLHELGRNVITIAVDKEHVNPMIIDASDRVIYYENLFEKVAEGDTPGGGADAFTDLASLRREYLQALQQAVLALEQRDRLTVGAEVAKQIRMIRSDFEPINVGCQNFKSFVQEAERAGVVTVEWGNGTGDYRIVLKEKALPRSSSTNPVAAVSPDNHTKTRRKEYKAFIDRKLGHALPDHKTRTMVLNMADETYKDLIARGPFSITQWKDEIDKKMWKHLGSPLQDQERVVFKTLLSLHYARCFSWNAGPLPHDPTIVGCLRPPDKWEDALIENFLRQLTKEGGFQELDPKALGQIFFPEDAVEGPERIQSLLENL